MKYLYDSFGQKVRLTNERIDHILSHPELAGMLEEIETTISLPMLVRRSLSDQSVYLYCEFFDQTQMGGKWLCVAIKYAVNDAFVVTAYLTDKPKPGEDLWPKK